MHAPKGEGDGTYLCIVRLVFLIGLLVLAVAPPEARREPDAAAQEPPVAVPHAPLHRVALVLEQPILRHHGSN